MIGFKLPKIGDIQIVSDDFISPEVLLSLNDYKINIFTLVLTRMLSFTAGLET